MRSYFYRIFILILFCAFSAAAQPSLTLPRASQASEVKQRIGLTDITINYSSPQVKGRKIWGELVPYGQVWRAGANENTTITFTDPVVIEGQKLAAGTYGLHMIPGESEWTIIFSTNSTSWGSFSYNKAEDALRVKVKPKEASYHEWLSYEFPERKDSSTVLALCWEKLSVPVKIDVNLTQTVLSSIHRELRNQQGFSWLGYYEAAEFCVQHRVNLQQALRWADQAMQAQPGFTTAQMKANVLNALGKPTEADQVIKSALAQGSENDLNLYGYQLLGSERTKEAIDIFRMNVKRHPDSWNTYDSLAEALAKSGDKKQALSNYKNALKKAPADQQARLQDTIKSLEAAM